MVAFTDPPIERQVSRSATTPKLSDSDLLHHVEQQRERIRSFVSRYPDLLTVIDTGIVLAQELSRIATVSEVARDKPLWCGLLWQTVSSYQRQSVHLILASELDAGFALLRMACELARDISCIGRDPSLLVVWEAREADRDRYRKSFKFDSSPAGQAAQSLYKFTSKMGVHGHRTTMSHATPSKSSDQEAQVVRFEVNEDAPFAGLDVWLASFFPLHGLCAAGLGLDDPVKFEPFAHLLEFVSSLNPISGDLGSINGTAEGEA